jgi:Zn-dependent protease/CBS domain-containing protein
MAFVAALLFFGSLLLHELGHAVVARREGMQIEGITLWVFGGVARFSGMFPSAGAEFRIAIAGPLVSLVIGVTLVAAAALASLPAEVDGVVAWLGRINLTLLAFNMLPALPLDGGRVLRSLIWLSTGDFTRATRIAGGLGRGFGLLLVWGGIALALIAGAPGALWLALIGWFVSAAATAETSLATMQHLLRGMRVADAMAREPAVVPAEATLQQFVNGVFPATRHAAYPVVSAGAVVGLLPFNNVAAVPPEQWPARLVRDAMVPLRQTLVLSPDEELGAAAMELIQDDLGRAPVVEGTRLAGLLSVTDVSRVLELRRLVGLEA